MNAREQMRIMEDTYRLAQAAATIAPSSGVASEIGERQSATREPTGLGHDTLKEMGVLIFPHWKDWLPTFDEDDPRWKTTQSWQIMKC